MTGESGERDLAGSGAPGAKDAAQVAADDPASRDEVDTGDPASLERWSEALGVPVEALEGAVKAVGTRVDRIKDYLTGGIAGDQEGG